MFVCQSLLQTENHASSVKSVEKCESERDVAKNSECHVANNIIIRGYLQTVSTRDVQKPPSNAEFQPTQATWVGGGRNSPAVNIVTPHTCIYLKPANLDKKFFTTSHPNPFLRYVPVFLFNLSL